MKGLFKVENLMTGMRPDEKREVLSNLVTTLLKDLNETEKEEMLLAVASGRKEGQRLAGLVDE